MSCATNERREPRRPNNMTQSITVSNETANGKQQLRLRMSVKRMNRASPNGSAWRFYRATPRRSVAACSPSSMLQLTPDDDACRMRKTMTKPCKLLKRFSSRCIWLQTAKMTTTTTTLRRFTQSHSAQLPSKPKLRQIKTMMIPNKVNGCALSQDAIRRLFKQRRSSTCRLRGAFSVNSCARHSSCKKHSAPIALKKDCTMDPIKRVFARIAATAKLDARCFATTVHCAPPSSTTFIRCVASPWFVSPALVFC